MTKKGREDQRDDETRYELLRKGEVYSAVWGGGTTTHLMTEEMRNMPSDCDRLTLCNRMLPCGDGLEIRDHPKGGRGEMYCPKCMGAIERCSITPAILEDDLWWEAHRKYKAGLPYDVTAERLAAPKIDK